MTWPLQGSLADVLDVGPGPSDPPEADWSLLDELATAVAALAERLKHEPGLSRAAAQLFCKLETDVSGVCFRAIVWPQARKLAGLPVSAGKGGGCGNRPSCFLSCISALLLRTDGGIFCSIDSLVTCRVARRDALNREGCL